MPADVGLPYAHLARNSRKAASFYRPDKTSHPKQFIQNPLLLLRVPVCVTADCALAACERRLFIEEFNREAVHLVNQPGANFASVGGAPGVQGDHGGFPE